MVELSWKELSTCLKNEQVRSSKVNEFQARRSKVSNVQFIKVDSERGPGVQGRLSACTHRTGPSSHAPAVSLQAGGGGRGSVASLPVSPPCRRPHHAPHDHRIPLRTFTEQCAPKQNGPRRQSPPTLLIEGAHAPHARAGRSTRLRCTHSGRTTTPSLADKVPLEGTLGLAVWASKNCVCRGRVVGVVD